MAQQTVTLPNGEVYKRLYKCADCGHVSDSHDSRFDGPREQATCEKCGEASLMLEPGEFVRKE
jgi:DNA replicative helicase MCM subunit Mcm2 (Cdc46/Mcm family)